MTSPDAESRRIDKLRRIVTAQDEQGLSYIARVEEVPPNLTQPLSGDVMSRFYPRGMPDVRVVWDRDRLPAQLPADPDAGPSGRLPGPQGARASVTIYPPGWEGEMFWANRVDIIWVMAGELTYRTDRGDEIVIGPGDVLIQNATNKAFFNRGSEPVYMGALMVNATHAGPLPPDELYFGPPEHLRIGDDRAD
jgi:hypothetical protein